MSAIHTLVSVLLGHITKHKRLRKAFHWCKLHVQPLQVLFQNHIARVWRERDEVPALEVTNELVKSSSRAAEAAFMSDIQDLQADEMDFGDFVTDRGEEAEVEFLSEPWPQYNEKDTTRPFYPVCVGERLNGRYLVEHKLGHGGFSTVWMAHDTEEEKDVALKIFSLDGSARNETRIQTEIKKRVQDKSHLVVAMDTFTLPRESIESYHIVHVLPLMGPCVVWEVTNQLSLAVRMSAACQLLNAVAALHKSGIVHRGT